MRILLLATDAYGGHGGIALFNRELAAALSRRHEVIVIPRIVPHEGEHIPPSVVFRAEAAQSDFAYARALVQARWESPDLVICGHMNLLPAACAIARRPLLLAFGTEAWRPPRSRISAWLVHRSRGVLAISRLTRNRFLAWSGYDGPTHVLPNPVRLEDYGIRPKRRDLVERYGLEGRRVLLTVGRLAPEERYKGFDEVIRVLSQLPPDVVYVIAGTGGDAPRLQQLAKEAGVEGRVVFTGAFREHEKADLYNLADVYVMPSRAEGFGFVLLEALAAGLPVIASKQDGGREALLDGKLGLLVDPANPAEIRAAILDMLECWPRRVPSELEYFSFGRFALRVDEVVARVM